MKTVYRKINKEWPQKPDYEKVGTVRSALITEYHAVHGNDLSKLMRRCEMLMWLMSEVLERIERIDPVLIDDELVSTINRAYCVNGPNRDEG